MVSTPGSVRRETSPTSVANFMYSSRYCGQTSIFDRRTMPSAAISSLAHMSGCMDVCDSFSVPPHDSSPNIASSINGIGNNFFIYASFL